ncbi:MAG: flagellar hook-basal body complex protein, partial [Rhodospirillales bacterium]|nr:flagellar hook-basal body complex protein [Rhodospirillales bacterium]
ATLPIGEQKQTAYTAYNSDGGLDTIAFLWTKTAINTWEVTGSTDGGTITSPAATSVTFNGDGTVNTPDSLTIAGTASGGEAISYELDITGLTQFAGSLNETFYSYNGSSNATLESVTFDSDGFVLGAFSDTTMRKLYKIPIATFLNPDGLAGYNGNVWAESINSGSVTERFLDTFGSAQLLTNTLESSNVELQDEFTKMLITQQAYNSSATVFRTVDEMTQVAKDLKR